VIGNPPYVRQEELAGLKDYFQSHYKTFQPTADLYVSFIEKGCSLIKSSGLFSMIVSNKWLRAAYGRPLREFLSNDIRLLRAVDLAGLPVFARATVRTVVLVASPVRNESKTFRYLAPPPLSEFRAIHCGNDLERIFEQRAVSIPLAGLALDGWSFSGEDALRIASRMRDHGIPLNRYIEDKPYFGVKTGFNKAFVLDRTTRHRLITEDPKSAEIIKPLLAGRDVRRYSIAFKERYLIWTYIGVPIDRYPAIFTHLKQFQTQLAKRWDKGNFWWELRACDYYGKFEKPKIIYPDISTSCRFALDRDGFFGSNTTYLIPSSSLYLLGILNSRLSQFYFSEMCAGLEGGGTTYLRFFGQYLQGMPICPINFSDPSDKARHDRMVSLVEQMLELHKRLYDARTTAADRELYQRQIDATDRAIDRLVYDLYGLTDEEIRIVEEATNLKP
jgi:hypothetical protein